MLSPLDDYPIHQIADVVRHVGPSDRNFYDRYYFNMHRCADDLFCIFGLGQYPNLAVQDGFFCVRRRTADGDWHRVVRASRELGADRMDTSVGPLRVEVLEGLKRLRFVVEPNEHGIAADVTWTGSHPAVLEPRHSIRRHGRVLFDTARHAQLGTWEGELEVAGERFAVTPDTWWGSRDRSWGVRPVGEPEAPGIHGTGLPSFFWNYAPVRFPDFSILYICQEEPDGSRILEEATMAFPEESGRAAEHLGRPEHHLEFVPGTRTIERATIAFPHAPGGAIEMRVEALLPVYLQIGTGYGREPDWGHGMYQGPLKVEGVHLDLTSAEGRARMMGLVDSVGRFTIEAPGRAVDGAVGYGLWEYVVVGPHTRYGFTGLLDPAP